MSNPCINRWGVNAFWHHYWYSDSRYALNLQQDSLVLDLLNVYLNYGSDFYTKMLWNAFWFKASTDDRRVNLTKYYRWVPVYSEIAMTSANYPFRLASEERFESRVNIMKFNSWYIVNLYWFQPDKKRKQRLKRGRVKYATNFQTTSKNSYTAMTKARTILSTSQKQLGQTMRYYTF